MEFSMFVGFFSMFADKDEPTRLHLVVIHGPQGQRQELRVRRRLQAWKRGDEWRSIGVITC
jgi:hypothetical protein